jgi:hypothetical protein
MSDGLCSSTQSNVAALSFPLSFSLTSAKSGHAQQDTMAKGKASSSKSAVKSGAIFHLSDAFLCVDSIRISDAITLVLIMVFRRNMQARRGARPTGDAFSPAASHASRLW